MDPEHDPVEGMLGMVGWPAPWAALWAAPWAAHVFALALCMSRNTSGLLEQAAGLNAPANIWDATPESRSLLPASQELLQLFDVDFDFPAGRIRFFRPGEGVAVAEAAGLHPTIMCAAGISCLQSSLLQQQAR